jgi:thiamine-phosphate pyrophosphorylase
VTDRSYCPEDEFLPRLEAALDAGVTWVQLREKAGWPDRQVWKLAQEIRVLTKARGIPLVVDDRLDLAMALDADGVHLGQTDLPLDALNGLWKPGKVWGVSVFASSEAQEAKDGGASYVGVGALFPTTSKDDARPVDPGLLGELRSVGLPLIGIGGITPARAGLLRRQGCAGVAVISAIWGAPDPAEAVRAFRRAWDGQTE